MRLAAARLHWQPQDSDSASASSLHQLLEVKEEEKKKTKKLPLLTSSTCSLCAHVRDGVGHQQHVLSAIKWLYINSEIFYENTKTSE